MNSLSDSNSESESDSNSEPKIDFQDAATATRVIEGLSGRGVGDAEIGQFLPRLLQALAACPDPDGALNAFARWFAATPNPHAELPRLQQPGVLARFCYVAACSHYFADGIVRHPEDFEIVAHPTRYEIHESSARRFYEIARLTATCTTVTQKRDLLRRWKAREMLGIGVRDLLHIDDMPTSAREFSHLADACIQMAVEITQETLGLPQTPPHRTRELKDKEREKSSPPANDGTPGESGGFPLAIFAMGKLGGQELNYSSDIDLIFIHADGLSAQTLLADGRHLETPVYLARLAETLLSVLSEETATGQVFRVDMRLRPEGRFGPLTRSLAGYRAYYEHWAENWERQALLKARFIAGNRSLGEAFLQMITPYVYRRQISRAFLNDIRLNKRRIEQTCARKGEEQTNIKTGYGGIRDIEFIVQMLQLEFGSTQIRLRTPNTLTALERLNEANFLTDRETEELSDDYRWLRTLEHRLQLLHGRQTQTMPPPDHRQERAFLARRMGYESREAFEADQHRRRQTVRSYLDRLFYDQDRRFFPALPEDIDPLWNGIVALLDAWDLPEMQAKAHMEVGERLAHAGFHDVTNALRLLQLLRHATEFRDQPPALSAPFKDLAPHLLDLVAQSPDPDAALSGIEMLAVPYRDPLYGLFLGRPDFMWRLIRLASVPPLIRQLARHQEWIYPLLSANDLLPDAVREDDQIEAPTPESAPEALRAERHVAEMSARIGKLQSRPAQLKLLALFYQRERLRIAASDVWDEADVADVTAHLTRLAEAMLEILLRFCAEARIAAHPNPDFARIVLSQVAILGLGRLGGAELNYSSDWDLLFVYDVERPRDRGADGSHRSEQQGERHALVDGLVQDILAMVNDLKVHGAEIEVDLRLRPWGRQGGLVYSVRGYLDYFRNHAQTWERQAVLKARRVAGSVRVGRRLERVLRAISVGRGLTAQEDVAVQAMKRRIEQERLKSLERATDLKLGHGGLSDIEWLAQRLQLRYGPKNRALHVHGTLRVLEALEKIKTEKINTEGHKAEGHKAEGAPVLTRSEVNVLRSAYRLLTQVRNAMTLLAGSPQDVFPADPQRRRVLSRLLGYHDTLLLRAEEILQEDVQADMSEVRRIFEQRFFGA